MYYDGQIWIAKSGDQKVSIVPKMANRHGLIAGATGTGKTITLKVMAESFSDCGVPVFLADIKGDLAGMCKPGIDTEDMKKRVEKFGLSEAKFEYHSYPSCFWDIYEKGGLPLRTTISEMGPVLLARLLDLNPTQSDILSIVFRIADDSGLLLLDLKDLKAMLQHVGDNYKDYTTTYGNITKQSVGAVIRSLGNLEDQGGNQFFGEPALDIRDWFQNGEKGRGVINILHCAGLIEYPLMYSTFMLWMLSELYEMMPEAGDLEKPRMVFFFDEAHLLFKGAPKALLEKIEQVVKLVRSKGVGIYFITQSPSDIPDEVLSQLGNKIQHALRAYTPADQKALKAAAQSFRTNPAFDTQEAISQLGIGEALVSFLDQEGRPGMVEICKILPPQSQMGAIADDERKSEIQNSTLYVKYATSVDRDSAYEFLQRKQQEDAKLEAEKAQEEQALEEKKERDKERAKEEKEAKKEKTVKRTRMSPVEKAAGSAMTAIGREVGRSLIRGLMKNLKF